MLKVLLYSHLFHPSVGGTESVSLMLAEGFCLNNIECIVITRTINSDSRLFPFDVIRNPGRKQQIELVKWADIVLFNGASLALQPWLLLLRKPFYWIHVGYQVSCIDGLGWVDGKRAPLTPWSSVKYHIKLKGLNLGVKEGIKLAIRRFFAKWIVTKNIAITKWMEQMQPLPRQVQIYNPFPIGQFNLRQTVSADYDFVFLGRIVSEKGVPILLNAFAKLADSGNTSSRLLIIGDGDWKIKMEHLAADLNIAGRVTFAGKHSGKDLAELVNRGKIAVVPSAWFEPMGGVVIELMAAGRNLIVSEFGGLKECAGDAALTFPNEDVDALAQCMVSLLNDVQLQREQKIKGAEQVRLFDPSIFIKQYIDLLNDATAGV